MKKILSLILTLFCVLSLVGCGRSMDDIIKNESSITGVVNCTPFVRQYGILSNKWGVLLCQKEYQTNDIRRNSKNW